MVDYTNAAAMVSVVVQPAALTVTANNGTAVYGQALPVLTGTITGVTNGDNITAAYSTAATNGSPAGTYAIVPSLVDPNDSQTNYTVTLVSATLTISQAATIITWTNSPPITYGTALSSNQLNATANVPGSFVYNLTNGAVPNAGTHILFVLFIPSDMLDYTVAATTVNLVVQPAALTVTANNATAVYGQPLPVLTGTIVGVTNGDDITAAYSTAATNGSPVGTYAIVAGLVDPNDSQTNYIVTLVSGTLTVAMPPVIQSAQQAGGLFTFTWSAITNKMYEIQSATSLAPPNWTNLGVNVTATNSAMTLSESIGVNPIQFYRVVLLP